MDRGCGIGRRLADPVVSGAAVVYLVTNSGTRRAATLQELAILRERGKFQPYEALYILSKVYDVNVGLTLMDWAIEKEA